jgi:hypothetical protein
MFAGLHLCAEQKASRRIVAPLADATVENWLRGLDSNQDNQLQRLACYQLHYPGNEQTFYFTIAGRRQKSSPREE